MAIMADDTSDISGEEHFSIYFRYAEPTSLKINEVFVKMYNPLSADIATLFCMNDLLVRICLDFKNDFVSMELQKCLAELVECKNEFLKFGMVQNFRFRIFTISLS